MTDILIGVVFTLFFISLSVIITINFRPLYYFDVNYLNIVETSGYSKEEIIDNYNALIDYSSPFFQGRLEFPTLPSSESGIQHFEEVKNIFTFFYLLVALSFIIVIMIILQKIKKKDYSFLPVSAITAIVLPLTLGLFMAIDFDTSFLVFHKLFFNNDYWLFDPATDPVINILPDTFFLHSALLIILLVLLGSLSLYLIYLHLNKKTGIKHRKIKGIKI
ncbi:TIGR01906 family membrane protein [Mobilitalea sibirica]|uniref:TIGR01906 family membrane protein n=1 Tax=Mobilitalea sibirica TaxID=1462919 RepID=A0A8J7H0K8_9FIRM|nr:TIGR01906 family membrane protein [Mobilitalea sibirica]